MSEPFEPVNGTEDDSIDDLKMNTVDPSTEVEEETGHKKFLKWKKQDDNSEQAVGEDGKIYTIAEVPPAKTYRLTIENP